MRIVIDMQGAQSSSSWNRGIGRYTMAFSKALVRNRREHEVLLALNGAFPASIERIRAQFEGILPQKDIRVWNAEPPTAYAQQENKWRRQSAELIREAFITSLNPDLTLLSSLFEGLSDDAVTSLKCFDRRCLTAVILYDLIPFIHRKPYLENPSVEAWYLEKIEHLRRADLWLAISESTRQEGVEYLNLPSGHCINISTDADDTFRKISVSVADERRLRKQYGLDRNFLMYTGGIDHRKNIEGLIRAYAKLSPQLRATHQLAIVCSVHEDSRHRLLAIATDEGMHADEIILTGFVPEVDLVALYNLCTAFVFPSWHEGFGLPVLEAMRCGAPVIAANASSLPEVVGYAAALFDPHSDEAMARAIERVLTDQAFRAQLVEQVQKQSAGFSWDETARRAIDAMVRAHVAQRDRAEPHRVPRNRPRLAYISPLPPERSGISDYSAELLPALSRHYEIEVVVAQGSITDAWINSNCPIRSIQWFIDNKNHFDRVLYHFGNSSFHQHMFSLLETIPGVVVLHDFYLSGIRHHMDALGYAPGCFTEQLYRSHGYIGLFDRTHAKDVSAVIWKYPCSRDVVENSIGVIAHSPNSIRLSHSWYGDNGENWSVIPLLRAPAITLDTIASRQTLGFSPDSFIICSFGMLGPTKLNHRLLRAWFDSELSKSDDCHLVFVGENHVGDYGHALQSMIKRHPKGSSVHITGWIDHETFRNYLVAADVGVQLRTLSRGETSAAVLDCMNYGLATIINANGSMADLNDALVLKLPDEFEDQALIDALETLWRDHHLRDQIGASARSSILEHHDPARCAKQYCTAIESFYTKRAPTLHNLLSAIGTLSDAPAPGHELIPLANSIATTLPLFQAGRKLLVDISGLVQGDAKTGIQHVVCHVLRNWLLNPPTGWRIEPIHAAEAEPYRYARRFTANFLEIPGIELNDDVVDFMPGDILFALDFQPHVQIAKADFYQELRQQGVTVKFMVYDLLCILQPQHFVPGAAQMFTNWLNVVGENDGAVCISDAVAHELREWMRDKTWNRARPFHLKWNALGTDFSSDGYAKALQPTDYQVLATLQQRMSFLMVGTIEPRKGHEQVVEAFEILWRKGIDVNLVLVGKAGLMAEKLTRTINDHNEFGARLFWLNGIDDDYISNIYANCTCLIAASYGEGFGLPLIEAAQHSLPIIARDIPVFREVGKDFAYYFQTSYAKELAKALTDWMNLHQTGHAPDSKNIRWYTWKECAERLLEKVIACD